MLDNFFRDVAIVSKNLHPLSNYFKKQEYVLARAFVVNHSKVWKRAVDMYGEQPSFMHFVRPLKN